jgi:hypothetical protein
MPAEQKINVRKLVSSDELVSAYRFIYREYVGQGYIEPNPLRIRIRDEFEFGWCMATFAAFHEDEIVGTMSLIEDGEHGIPLEQYYPQIVSDARFLGDICEISNMVVSPAARGGISILRGLMLAVWDACRENSERYIFIAVSPKHVDYFSRSFRFKPIGPPMASPPSDIIQGMMVDAMSDDAITAVESLVMAGDG